MISKRTEEMTSFIVMDVLERANEMEREGVHVIHLEVGEPDFDTPVCVKEAAFKALDDGHTHYTHSLGLFELREAICKYYYKTYSVSVDPDQVIVTSGSSPAIFLVFATLLDKDDRVIISDPHYACYPNFIKFVQGAPVTVPVYEEDGFQYRPESIQEKIVHFLDQGADLIITSGGMSVDPDDVTRVAIQKAGADNIIYGSPVLPGAMFLIAYVGDIPILGVPAGAIFHKITMLDLVLPRVLTGERFTRDTIAEMGHGGLCLLCLECRYPICPFGK